MGKNVCIHRSQSGNGTEVGAGGANWEMCFFVLFMAKGIAA